MDFVFLVLVVLILGAVGFYAALRARHMHIWIWDFIKHSVTKPSKKPGTPTHVIFAFVDHYEPQWENDDIEVERARVDRWMNDYPKMAEGHVDADGVAPKHTFFYPEEEYRKEHLDKLADLCNRGYGEVEIHIHHDDDTEENFRDTLRRFKKILVEDHQLLSRDPDGNVGFAFVHGNWALDNSLPGGVHCGLNNELEILADEGCFVDMTLPSAPSPAQTSTVNRIYMAIDDVDKPKSHDRGERVSVGKGLAGDLMIVQGPLSLNWKSRKLGIIPRIENGDIRFNQLPLPERMDMWVNQHICIEGREDWVFVKIHTHGTQEEDMDALLGKAMDDFYTYVEKKYNDGENYVLHYVSAREMYNIVRAASDGKSGNPNEFRDYWYKKIPDWKPSAS